MTGLPEFGSPPPGEAGLRKWTVDTVNKIKLWSREQVGGKVLFNSTTNIPEKNVQDAIEGLSARIELRGMVRVRVATTANITIATALNAGDTIDGITLAAGDVVLVWNQSAPAENGIYVAGTTPARHPSFDTYDDHAGLMVVVQEGSTYAARVFLCTAVEGGTLDTTAIDFDHFAAPATTSIAGVIETATQAEMEAASATNKAVTPGRQHFHPSAAKLWGHVTVSSGTPSIADSYNLTSITDSGVGILTVTIATDFSSANYAVIPGPDDDAVSGTRPYAPAINTQSAGSFVIAARDGTGNVRDPSDYRFVAYGDQS